MPSEIPRLARNWIGYFLAAMVGALAWGLIVNWNSWRGLLIFGGLLLVVAVSGVRILSTTLTDQGVSQRTWRGETFIRWDDVRSVRFQGKGGIALEGSGGKIVIPGAFYTDLDGLLAWLAARMPRVWPQ